MNAFGQLGIGRHQTPSAFDPQWIHINSRQAAPISHIACGGAHTLAVDINGRLYATGSNSCGQLGVMTSNVDQFDPTIPLNSNDIDNCSDQFIRVAGLGTTPCSFCACGEEFSAVVTKTRTVYTWGLGLAGQIGDGELENRSFPTKVNALDGKGKVYQVF